MTFRQTAVPPFTTGRRHFLFVLCTNLSHSPDSSVLLKLDIGC